MMKRTAAVPEGVLVAALLRTKPLRRESAATWRLSQRQIMIIFVLPIVVAAAGAFSALLGKEAYKWFTGEDGFAETWQVICYSLAFVMALFVAWRYQRGGERMIALLYVGLSLGFLFLIGEEISWGQRFFNWNTPAALVEINKQNETTLHNIHSVEDAFKWIQMLVGAYGTILPLALLFWPLRDKWERLADAVVPHYTLLLYFLPMFIWRIFRNTLEVPARFRFVVAEYNEVIELILAIGFVLFLAFQRRQLQRRADDSLALQ